MKLLILLALYAPLLCEGAHGAGPGNNERMYDPEFFPTPTEVLTRMLQPWLEKYDVGRYKAKEEMRNYTILDPSAGSGAMLKYVEQLFTYGEEPTLHAIEVNPDMQPLLREQFTLVHDDFLTFQSDVRYDLILMNPPFSNGDAHLEKAWNVMQHGHIVCLLNAETIRNPHTKRRQWLVDLIEQHGSVEYIGPAFKYSQRPTEVDVALVRLQKHDEADRFQFWEDEAFQPEEQDFSFTEESMSNMPAVNDRIAAMVHQYQLSQQSFVEYMKAYRRMIQHAGSLVGDRSLKELMANSVESGTGKACFNTFVSGLQRMAWDEIFQRTKINDLMTRGVRADFEKMRKSQGGMPLTEANIHNLLQLLFLNRETILQRCIEEAFDVLCAYHEGNKSHWEGWRTNNAFKVNRKVIMPDWAVRYDKDTGNWGTSYYGETHAKWDDIDRAMAMLDGKTLSSAIAMESRKTRKKKSYSADMEERPIYRIYDALTDRFHELNENRKNGERYHHYQDNVCESEYFHIKFWKKGTVHLVFKSEELWQRFNLQAAGGKKWVPYDMDRKPTPTSDPADQRYAKKLAEVNAENAKLLLTA